MYVSDNIKIPSDGKNFTPSDTYRRLLKPYGNQLVNMNTVMRRVIHFISRNHDVYVTSQYIRLFRQFLNYLLKDILMASSLMSQSFSNILIPSVMI